MFFAAHILISSRMLGMERVFQFQPMILTVDKFESWKGCGGWRHRLFFSAFLGRPRRRQHRLVEQLLGQGGVFEVHGLRVVLAGPTGRVVILLVRPLLLPIGDLPKVPLLVEEPQQKSQMLDRRRRYAAA